MCFKDPISGENVDKNKQTSVFHALLPYVFYFLCQTYKICSYLSWSINFYLEAQCSLFSMLCFLFNKLMFVVPVVNICIVIQIVIFTNYFQ